MPKAKILEIKMSGALVLLDNEEKAWLPRQELSTDYTSTKGLNDQEICHVGQELDVIVYGNEFGTKKKLVSHVRFNGDPWDQVKLWKDGDAKEIHIYSITATRAYGWIKGGIAAFIELTDIYDGIDFPPSWQDNKTISVGDVVIGCVNTNGIDNANRLVKLTASHYIKNLQNIPEFLPIGRKDLIDTPVREEPAARDHQEMFIPLPPDIRHILVVDDDELFLQEFGSYLEGCGIMVTLESSRSGALNVLENPECPDFDAAFLDLHLTKGYDYHGLEFTKEIVKRQPRCRVIIITGMGMEGNFDWEEMVSISGDLLISALLFKPFGIQEVSGAISRAMTENPKKLEDFFSNAEKPQEPPPVIMDDIMSTAEVAEGLRKEVEAEAAILFSIHPVSYEVRIETHSGILRERVNELLPRLRYSPVKDVAIDRETIFENKISKSNKYNKHRWLVAALKYESCVGFPISLDHDLYYCLFVFHGNKDHFNDTDKFKVKTTADKIAYILSIQKLEETIRLENPFYLAGKTYGSMAHDLVNALNREFGFPAILKLIDGKKNLEETGLKEIRKRLETFRAELKRAEKIVRTFRRMSRSHHEEETEVDVIETVNKAVEITEVEAGALRVAIRVLTVDKDVPTRVIMKQTGLEQVLYNLFLNAAQQIALFSFARERGNIAVEVSNIAEGDKEWIQVLIHDSGPGIHVCNFKKIFQKGYTTKEDGCGMGLDICRNILKQCGGEIRVLKSILFCGTTFEIRLPLNL